MDDPTYRSTVATEHGSHALTGKAPRSIGSTLTVGVLLLVSLSGCLASSDADVGDRDSDRYASTYHAALLWDEPYSRLEVQVSHVPRIEPTPGALDVLVETLLDVTGKQSVQITQVTLPEETRFEPSEKVWTYSQLNDLHREFFTLGDHRRWGERGGDTAYMHILYLNGHHKDSQGNIAGGVSLGDVNGIFLDSYGVITSSDPENNPYPPYNPAPEEVERYILVHEVGHSLGLVGKIPMTNDRRPSSDNHHSTNPESVMYYRAHPTGTAFMEWIMDNQWVPYRYDEDDLADLAAFRARQPSHGQQATR